MAYDSTYFKALIQEMKILLINKRLDKIFQHSDESLSFIFSGLKEQRLYMEISGHAPRILITGDKLENPKQAPMFCMLLRKHLKNSILKDISQINEDRIAEFIFDARDEMGYMSEKSFIVEIMGRHSNCILVDQDRIVMDSLKHVNPLKSSRPMGPGYVYKAPFIEKINVGELEDDRLKLVIEDILGFNQDLKKALYSSISGMSPQIAESLILKAGDDLETGLFRELRNLDYEIKFNMKPYIYYKDDKLFEISAVKLEQFNNMKIEIYDNFSKLSEVYFENRGKSDIIKVKSKTLSHTLNQLISREKNRIKNLKNDLKKAEKFEKQKLYGELITANIHAIKNGSHNAGVLNYYTQEEIDIPLNPNLTAGENANQYFKKYQKMKRTVVFAEKQIQNAKESIEYLESVVQLLDEVESSEEIDDIRKELESVGILKNKTPRNNKKQKKLLPREYTSPNGFKIKVGRNNVQNDELTLKKSSKNDIWFHTKNIPSAHVVMETNSRDVEENDIIFAAEVCAKHSKASNSENVPVDYTLIKNVSKPSGGKPGKVIYVKQKTVYVKPLI